MKEYLLLIAFIVVTPCFADTYVHGYYTKNGTYVEPHYRSDNNGSAYDNWSTRGNQNPYTGQYGTRTENSYSSRGVSSYGSINDSNRRNGLGAINSR